MEKVGHRSRKGTTKTPKSKGHFHSSPSLKESVVCIESSSLLIRTARRLSSLPLSLGSAVRTFARRLLLSSFSFTHSVHSQFYFWHHRDEQREDMSRRWRRRRRSRDCTRAEKEERQAGAQEGEPSSSKTTGDQEKKEVGREGWSWLLN